ncbi:4Fe-4S binding protein [Desulfovibrio sp. OttesenSCG-928-C14]|nr:4Fe-4S binding protein [Desulfovibrio sp. OttesenSCG-928-C14]
MKKSSFSWFRALIQISFALFFLYVGWRFYHYYLWASGAVPDFTPRPPAAEAFLPISALVGLKRLLLGNGFDPIHPAGLSIFIMAIVISLIARKGFCGYFCPVGWFCQVLDKLGRRLGISRSPGRFVSLLISLPKYILLGLFVWLIVINMPGPAIEQFLFTPYNKVADSKMLVFFLDPSRNTLIGLGVILIGSMLVPGFWCRGFCPYGALLGLFSWLSPFAVRRDKEKCTYCRRCSKACPVRIPVYRAGRVSGPECQGCLECVAACPEPGCLSLTLGYGKARLLKPLALPLLCLGLLCLGYFTALAADAWYSQVPPEELKMYHRVLNLLSH